MNGKGLGLLGVILAFLCIAMPASAASAAGAAERCSTPLSADVGLIEELEQGPRWHCPADFDDLAKEGNVVRFRVDPADPPAYVVSRIAAFGSLAIAVRDQHGWAMHGRYEFSQISPTYLDRQFAVPLGELPAGAQEVAIAIYNPTQAIPFDFMRLEKDLPGSSEADFVRLLIIALVCGVILAPLLFDFIFYRVLRENFILWHAAFVLCVAAQLSLTAGLYQPFVDLNVRLLRVMTVTSFAAMVTVAMMFVSSFLEKDALTPRMRKVMKIAACAFLIPTALHAPGLTAFGAIPAILFYCGGVPLGVTVLVAVTQAWRRGSIFVRYVLFAMAPLFLISMARVVGFVLPGIPTEDYNGLFLVGVLIEAVGTAMGVAARFVKLKRERDQARMSARAMETIAGKDPLTGLMNRRAIEPGFRKLHRSGYETLALLDLDHFKTVNDTFGHATGDEVLRAAAIVLDGEEGVLAARIGGEEFLLLLRGEDGVERAERLRQAIPARVASEVPGLSRPVTASMGVVSAPVRAVPQADFRDLYTMADRLLYEAKGSGRNCMMFEKLRAFRKDEGKPRQDRRKRASA